MIEHTRDAFETEILKNKAAFQICKVASGEYQSGATQEIWGYWQAATKAERKRCAKVCKSERVGKNDNEGDIAYNLAINHCVAAIRQRGDA